MELEDVVESHGHVKKTWRLDHPAVHRSIGHNNCPLTSLYLDLYSFHCICASVGLVWSDKCVKCHGN